MSRKSRYQRSPAMNLYDPLRGWCSDPLYLGTKPVILVNPATDLKPALEVGLCHPWGSLLVEDDGDGEAGYGRAGLVSEC